MKLQTSEEDLFAGLQAEGRYDHLKLFLSRKNEPRKLPMYFLWVSRDAVGKVRLDDLDFDGTQIQLSLQDCTTGFKKLVSIDIDDTEFKLLLISWDDIRSMVLDENKSMVSDDELLNFE